MLGNATIQQSDLGNNDPAQLEPSSSPTAAHSKQIRTNSASAAQPECSPKRRSFCRPAARSPASSSAACCSQPGQPTSETDFVVGRSPVLRVIIEHAFQNDGI